MSSTCFAFFSIRSYRIRKPCSGSTAPSLGTRSRTWPYDARTVKSLPRYLLIVLALAGDSTMRRFLAMRSEEHTSELQSLMRISYAVFCLQKKHKSKTKYQLLIHQDT